MKADVIGIRGQSSLVKTQDHRVWECLTTKQQDRLCCGDRVTIDILNEKQCALSELLPRRTLLYRADPFKKKLIAANITQIAIVTAIEPAFSDELISRVLAAATINHIGIFIVLNKTDLQEGYQAARQQLAVFENMGIDIVETSTEQPLQPLLYRLFSEVTLLIGQSGMGKSTILNRLIPSANALTREVSVALNSGKHTTTASTFYQIPDHPKLIDSPGLQQFGLYGYEKSEIEQAFIEFRPYIGHCRFNNCSHLEEPDCAIRQAVESGAITQRRLDIFHKIIDENSYTHY